MLKGVQFLGFESNPDLRQHFEHLIPQLRDELGRLSCRVDASLELKAGSAKPRIALTLSLAMPHISGEDTDDSLVSDVMDPASFRRWVRFVWENVLGKMLEERVEVYERELNEVGG